MLIISFKGNEIVFEKFTVVGMPKAHNFTFAENKKSNLYGGRVSSALHL